MRSLVITTLVAIFSILTSIVAQTGVLPNANTAATNSLNNGAINEMVNVQSVSSNDSTGQIGFFNMLIKIAFMIGGVILGTLVVTIPLYNLGVPLVYAAAINSFLALITFGDMLLLWKGVHPWYD